MRAGGQIPACIRHSEGPKRGTDSSFSNARIWSQQGCHTCHCGWEGTAGQFTPLAGTGKCNSFRDAESKE